jgi:hypothetical protein
MKYVCPVCKTSGRLDADDLVQPMTKTSCPNCEAILLINSDSGKVETHKSSLKVPPVLEDTGRAGEDAPPVLAMSARNRQPRDWIAIGVVVAVLLAILSLGAYFAMNTDIFRKPLQSVSEFVKDLSRNVKPVEKE